MRRIVSNMNYREYSESGYDLYADYASTIRRIVKIALDQSKSAFRLQAIQERAKSPASLQKKLEMQDLLGSDQVEGEIKDLAGCRLIFYTNNDINRFLSSQLIVDNFEVDWDKSKIHQPIKDTDPAYVATHYVVSLNEDRLNLPEYEKFRDLRCEIQIQSILNHAWAETSHDIVYKQPSLDGFGSSQFQSIERRMQVIMTKYLMPAGYEFQKIELDFERLLTGKELFEEGGLDKLESCVNNNSRFEILEKFRDFVLPQYDHIAAAFPDIRRHLVDVVKAGRTTDTVSIETPFGVFDGKTHEQVTDVALEILERLKYINVDEVFSALCEIYLGRESDSEGERILKAVDSLASHNLKVWKQAGPYVQSKICDRISALDQQGLESIFSIAVRALSQVLSVEAKSTTSTYSTDTLHRAAVQPSEALTAVRATALDILEGMYSPDRSEQDRRQVLAAIWKATDGPRLGKSLEELDLTVLHDSTRVLRYMMTISDGESFELNQHLEDKAYWLWKRYRQWAQDDTHPSQELVDVILEYRDQINQNNEFVIYKTLVGFKSVFPPQWEEPEFDRQAKEQFRNKHIAELLDSFDAHHADEWKKRVIRCAQTESIDAATFPHFDRFLSDLAQTKPQIVMDWLVDLDDKLECFLPSIILGLEKSDAAKSADKLVGQWIEAGDHVSSIARAARFSDDLCTTRLTRIVEAAKRGDDVSSLLDVIAAIFRKCTDENFAEVHSLALECIDHCTKLAENRWIHNASIYARDSVLLGKLNADQATSILNNLKSVNNVDYDTEALLSRLGENYPNLVIDFFGERLRRDRDTEPGSGFDAIPYSFQELDSVLRVHPGLVVALSRELFDEDTTLFEFRGGRLIPIVFSELTDELEAVLLDQLKDGDDSGIDFVLTVLRSYEGQTFLHVVVKKIVCILGPDDERLDLVNIALDSTGAVSGEFGMRNAYQRKKVEVTPWLEDERDQVRLFAERYIRALDRQIAAEQRRTKEDIEMRKRDYGEDDSAGDD